MNYLIHSVESSGITQILGVFRSIEKTASHISQHFGHNEKDVLDSLENTDSYNSNDESFIIQHIDDEERWDIIANLS